MKIEIYNHSDAKVARSHAKSISIQGVPINMGIEDDLKVVFDF